MEPLHAVPHMGPIRKRERISNLRVCGIIIIYAKKEILLTSLEDSHNDTFTTVLKAWLT